MTSKNPNSDAFHPIEAMANNRHEFGEHGGVNMSIETSTTFTVMDPERMPEIFAGHSGPETGGCYLYSRHFNPTVYNLSRELAAMEGTEAAYCTASGMGAVMGAIFQLCNHGDHVVASTTLYGGSFALLKDFMPLKAGITTDFVDIRDLAAVEAAIRPNTRALYIESVANPTLVVADIEKLAELAHRRGIALVVDNTFSPLMISPAKLGADVVIHSMTKYISGASDIIAGVICSSKEFIGQLMDLHTGALMLLGPTMEPTRAFDLSTRLPHLGLRVREHSRRAMVFAERLQAMGYRVAYPGLPNHPQHELMKSMLNDEFGYGGIFTIDMGSQEAADRLMECLQNDHAFGYMAVSLGYHHTLMSCSASSTSSELNEQELASAHIPAGLLRMSLGYTGSLEQRWTQLTEALETCKA
jgi:methionine-gamma-lyase